MSDLTFLLNTLHEEFVNKLQQIKNDFTRPIQFPIAENKIKVAIGMRRTGKTHFLLKQAQQLLDEQIPSSRILYINFEDDRLLPMDYKRLGKMIDTFYTLHPENHDKLCYIFLDEIQNVAQWAITIRRIFDTKKAQIYLTGSSAKLLSKEIATSLRGRSITTEIWPYSFNEYLNVNNISIDKIIGQKTMDKLKQDFRNFLKNGGFPETLSFEMIEQETRNKIVHNILGNIDYQKTPSFKINQKAIEKKIQTLSDKKTIKKIMQHVQLHEWTANVIKNIRYPEILPLNPIDKIRILQDYVNVVVCKDVIERYKLTNTILIKYMIKFLLRNIGCQFSITKFLNDLKSQGIPASKSTIYNYLNYLEDAYLLFTVSLYNESLRKVQSNPKKIYAIDTGLINAYNTTFTANLGHLFENLVYIELRRQGHEVFYYLTKNRYEVDFLTKSPKGKMHLFQVVWDYSDKNTMQRETRALKEAEEELEIKGKIITPESFITDIWRKILTEI